MKSSPSCRYSTTNAQTSAKHKRGIIDNTEVEATGLGATIDRRKDPRSFPSIHPTYRTIRPMPRVQVRYYELASTPYRRQVWNTNSLAADFGRLAWDKPTALPWNTPFTARVLTYTISKFYKKEAIIANKLICSSSAIFRDIVFICRRQQQHDLWYTCMPKITTAGRTLKGCTVQSTLARRNSTASTRQTPFPTDVSLRRSSTRLQTLQRPRPIQHLTPGYYRIRYSSFSQSPYLGVRTISPFSLSPPSLAPRTSDTSLIAIHLHMARSFFCHSCPKPGHPA